MNSLLVYPAVFDLSIAAIHLGFWKLFRWESQLAKLHAINKGAMQAMNIALVCFFGLIAYLFLTFPVEVITTELGRTILGGVALIWGIRTLVQLVVFPRNSKLSWAFFALCAFGTALHWLPLMTI